MNEIKIGDTVCLVFDESKRFIVESPMDNASKKIMVAYFNEFRNEITRCDIDMHYLKRCPQANAE